MECLFLDEGGDKERGICIEMKILQINILCYGNEMMQRVTAIGCGTEESSSGASCFCYQ